MIPNDLILMHLGIQQGQLLIAFNRLKIMQRFEKSEIVIKATSSLKNINS